jgi:hypothetical protein
LEHVLTVPVQAILGAPSMGHRRKCFVMTADGPQERDILIGLSNSRSAEIKEGLQEGDQVVLNPRVLLTEKEKLRPAAVSDKHSEEETNGSGMSKNGSGEKKDKHHSGVGHPDEKTADPLENITSRFRKASLEQRKQMLKQLPEAFREPVKQMLLRQGIKIPN